MTRNRICLPTATAAVFAGSFIAAKYTAAGLAAILYMGAAASGAGYFMFNLSIRENGPTRTAGIAYSLVPVFTAVLAFFFFGKTLTPAMFFSAALLIAGLRLLLAAPPGNPVT